MEFGGAKPKPELVCHSGCLEVEPKCVAYTTVAYFILEMHHLGVLLESKERTGFRF